MADRLKEQKRAGHRHQGSHRCAAVFGQPGALLGSLPVVILYSFFVEYYVAGMTGSGEGIAVSKKKLVRVSDARMTGTAVSLAYAGPIFDVNMDSGARQNRKRCEY